MGRKKVMIDGVRVMRYHAVWNAAHPDDPVKPGEAIHHIDGDVENDVIENLQKMSQSEHKTLHSRVGTEALRKWQKENPEKARKRSQENANELQKKLKADPKWAAEIREKRRDGTIKANKRRRGEKKSEEWKRQASARMKKIWAERKRGGGAV
jgi:hypothetical protein